VSGPLKAAWGLVAFVVVVGAVLWIATGQAVFAVFIVLGVLTGIGAWLTGRSVPSAPTRRKEQKP
jgi:dolichol kinase